ncbi:hypothetical protein IWQ61_003988 [Dispira simplex]|nr:hypothetical protein IWQ61_003988 [Dispira simplex]
MSVQSVSEETGTAPEPSAAPSSSTHSRPPSPSPSASSPPPQSTTTQSVPNHNKHVHATPVKSPGSTTNDHTPQRSSVTWPHRETQLLLDELCKPEALKLFQQGKKGPALKPACDQLSHRTRSAVHNKLRQLEDRYRRLAEQTKTPEWRARTESWSPERVQEELRKIFIYWEPMDMIFSKIRDNTHHNRTVHESNTNGTRRSAEPHPKGAPRRQSITLLENDDHLQVSPTDTNDHHVATNGVYDGRKRPSSHTVVFRNLWPNVAVMSPHHPHGPDWPVTEESALSSVPVEIRSDPEHYLAARTLELEILRTKHQFVLEEEQLNIRRRELDMEQKRMLHEQRLESERLQLEKQRTELLLTEGKNQTLLLQYKLGIQNNEPAGNDDLVRPTLSS